MNAKTSDIPKQQEFFTEYWNLYKKYYEMWNEPNKDKLWELFITEIDLIRSNYKGTDIFDFVVDMLLVLTNELIRKCGEVEKNDSKTT